MEFGAEIDPLPSVATPATAPTAPPLGFPEAQSAGTTAGNSANSLGLADPELDDLKDPAKLEVFRQTATKRPKLTHGHFFEDDKGLKKVLRTFPKIKFKGKGGEFDDLKLLVRNFERWFKELYPYGKDFEDSVWDMRRLLQDNERSDEGILSDPREKLHLFRFQWKNSPPPSAVPGGKDLSDDQKRRIEENRRRAMEKKQQREGGGGAAPASSSRPSVDDPDFDMETAWRIEENRQRALKLKQAKLATAAAAIAPLHPEPQDMDDDVFGFGGGFDEAELAAPAQQRAVGQVPGPVNSMMDEEEDVFGFDDEPMPPQRSQPAPAATRTQLESSTAGAGLTATVKEGTSGKQQATLTLDEDEEDIFGFGCGIDDAPVAVPAQPNAPEITQAAGSSTTIPEDEEDIFGFGGGFENPPAAPPAQPQAPKIAQVAAPSNAVPEDDEDIFGFGGGFENPPAAPPAQPQAPKIGQVAAPSNAVPEDDEDVFGFGDGLDNPQGAAVLQPQIPKSDRAADPSNMVPGDDDDGFGFGGTLDDPLTPAPMQSQAPKGGHAAGSSTTFPEEDDDDIFGIGGGLDIPSVVPLVPSQASKTDAPVQVRTQLETELDVTGHTATAASKEGTTPAVQPNSSAQPQGARILDGPLDLDDSDDDPFGFGGI